MKTFKQFIKFSMIGVVNTAVDFCVYVLLARIAGMYFLVANFFAVLIAMTLSFFLNRRWTFRNTDPRIKRQYLKFVMVNIGYLMLNNGIVYVLVAIFDVYDLYA